MSGGGGGVSVGGGGLVYTQEDEIVVGARKIAIEWRERYMPEVQSDGGYVMKGGLADLVDRDLGKPALIYFYSSKMDAAVFIGGTPEQFAAYVREQTETFASIARLLGIKPE